MWQRNVSAIFVAAIIILGISSTVYGATFTQSITESITAISGQGTDHYQTVGETVNTIQAQANDGYASIRNFIATIAGQFCNGLASSKENIGLLQGNHTVGQTLGSAPSGSYSSSTLLQCGPLVIVIPCDFFQVQCWMYPLLMMALVGGLMFAAVEPSRPTKEAITYILLATFTYTSAVEVLMGLLPITMPLLLTVIMVVYAWRFR